jgi:anti-anti-sigma factor
MTQYSADSQFGSRIECGDDVLHVSLYGELIYETLAPLQSCWELVRGQFRPTLVLDLSEVTYLSSGALGSILALRRWAIAKGGRLYVSALSWQVREVVQVTNLTKLLLIDQDAGVTAA